MTTAGNTSYSTTGKDSGTCTVDYKITGGNVISYITKCNSGKTQLVNFNLPIGPLGETQKILTLVDINTLKIEKKVKKLNFENMLQGKRQMNDWVDEKTLKINACEKYK